MGYVILVLNYLCKIQYFKSGIEINYNMIIRELIEHVYFPNIMGDHK
jgi:hypothetical protein